MSTFLLSKKATGGRQRLLLAKGALPLGCYVTPFGVSHQSTSRLGAATLSLVKVGVCFGLVFPLLDQITPIGRLVPVN